MESWALSYWLFRTYNLISKSMEKFEQIYINIVFGILGILGYLLKVLWHSTTRRLSELEKSNRNCPIHRVNTDISEIKNDIKWIKGYLFKGDNNLIKK